MTLISAYIELFIRGEKSRGKCLDTLIIISRLTSLALDRPCWAVLSFTLCSHSVRVRVRLVTV